MPELSSFNARNFGFLLICAYIIFLLYYAITKELELAKANLYPIFLDEAEKIQIRRHARVREICRRYPNMPHANFFSLTRSLEIKEGENITMCKLAKVGTTTFAAFFKAIGKDEEPEEITANGGQKNHVIYNSMGDNMEELQASFQKRNFFTFVFVRHPFDRVVSAYEDIFRDKNKIEFDMYGNKSFVQFVDYLIAQLEGHGCVDGKCCGIKVHWKPFYYRCDFCRMNYDFIGKLETFANDMLLLIYRASLTNRVPINATLGIRLNQQTHTIDNRTATYFAMITRDKRQRLYEIYKMDFLLFGYSPEPYL